jgi:hypothetical protein
VPLRFLDERESVSFYTFSLPVDHCLRLLLKNVDKYMPESEIPENQFAGRNATPVETAG